MIYATYFTLSILYFSLKGYILTCKEIMSALIWYKEVSYRLIWRQSYINWLGCQFFLVFLLFGFIWGFLKFFITLLYGLGLIQFCIVPGRQNRSDILELGQNSTSVSFGQKKCRQRQMCTSRQAHTKINVLAREPYWLLQIDCHC